MSKISVAIKRLGTAYDIDINSGTAEKNIEFHAAAGGFFVIDKNIASLYPALIPEKRVYIFDASEKSKNLKSVEKILLWLENEGALRDGKLIAIGGGITGDTAGFAAALYMRGIKIIQMPTTLLAMVDSSVGGKTGVNLGGIKNNIGAFHQPWEVAIDINFLKTLSDEEFLSGLAESIKIACVYGRDFFYFIKANKDNILERDSKTLEAVIEKSCALKAKIVERDEREGGLRKLLNFGHTVGHAIESDSLYSVSHGYAVAVGMIYESFFALENRYTDEKTFTLIKETIESFGYETRYVPKNKNVFMDAIAKDKKASQSGISLALTGFDLMGKIVNDITPEDLGESVFKYVEGGR